MSDVDFVVIFLAGLAVFSLFAGLYLGMWGAGKIKGFTLRELWKQGKRNLHKGE